MTRTTPRRSHAPWRRSRAPLSGAAGAAGAALKVAVALALLLAGCVDDPDADGGAASPATGPSAGGAATGPSPGGTAGGPSPGGAAGGTSPGGAAGGTSPGGAAGGTSPGGAAGGGSTVVAVANAAPMPLPRTEVAGAAHRGGVVVAGGLTEAGAASSRVDRYDADRDVWTRLPDLPVALHHTGVAALGDRLLVVGGFRDGPGGWVPDARVWSLDADADAWVEAPSLRTPRGALAVAVADGTLTAVGGVGPGGEALASTERFDGDGWSPGPSLPQGREHLAATATPDGRVLVIGGRRGGIDTNFATTAAIDGDDVTDAGDLKRSRGGVGAATVDGVPCVAGGEEPAGTIAPVECLLDDGWRGVATLATPRHGLAVVALVGDGSTPSRLHVIGGGPEPGLTVSDAHEVLEVRAGR